MTSLEVMVTTRRVRSAPESIYTLPRRVDEVETKVHGSYLALIYILLEGRHEETMR